MRTSEEADASRAFDADADDASLIRDFEKRPASMRVKLSGYGSMLAYFTICII